VSYDCDCGPPPELDPDAAFLLASADQPGRPGASGRGGKRKREEQGLPQHFPLPLPFLSPSPKGAPHSALFKNPPDSRVFLTLPSFFLFPAACHLLLPPPDTAASHEIHALTTGTPGGGREQRPDVVRQSRPTQSTVQSDPVIVKLLRPAPVHVTAATAKLERRCPEVKIYLQC
jgi:hypothetical protein